MHAPSICSQWCNNLTSAFFLQDIPAHQHPVIVLQGVQFLHLKCLLCFIYHGEVNVSHAHLTPLLALAESLQVKGLARSDNIEVPRAGSAQYEVLFLLIFNIRTIGYDVFYSWCILISHSDESLLKSLILNNFTVRRASWTESRRRTHKWRQLSTSPKGPT